MAGSATVAAGFAFSTSSHTTDEDAADMARQLGSGTDYLDSK